VTTAAAVPSVTAGPGPRAWRRFRRHRLAVTGAAVLALMALAAVLAPWLAPHDPYDLAVGPSGEIAFAAPPSLAFPLGTDSVGRDVLSRLLYGGRVSLTIGLVAALVAISVGSLLGVVAGYYGRGVDRVVIRDGDAISAMLTRLGAHETLLKWEDRRMRREIKASANRLANFDDANLRRSAQAAVAAGARVERALEILGDEVPDHLKDAGMLRLAHKQASLEELGQLHQPPLTKDAIAGRIRRLLSTADKRAAELGIPGTEACLTPEMLDRD